MIVSLCISVKTTYESVIVISLKKQCPSSENKTLPIGNGVVSCDSEESFTFPQEVRRTNINPERISVEFFMLFEFEHTYYGIVFFRQIVYDVA